MRSKIASFRKRAGSARISISTIRPALTLQAMTAIGRPPGPATTSPAAPFTRAGCEVFSYVTDPARFAEWQYDVVSVRMAEGGPPRVGSRFTTTRRIGRAERTMTQEITTVSPPRTWAARGVDGPVRPSASITVEPAGDPARSRVTIALDFEGRGSGRVLVPLVIRPMAAKGAPASYRHLKERLEGGG
jgi:uncharacterized protein YndB with AHSA1/START domain